MHPAAILSAASLLSPRTYVDGVANFKSLQNVTASATLQILSTLNSTQALNGTSIVLTGTSGLLTDITTAIMDSKTTLESDPMAFVNYVTSDVLDVAYLEYINEMPTFASVVAAQGRTWQSATQPGQPVVAGIQGLANAIQLFSNDLRMHGLISQTATIRTIRAGSSLVQAERAWSQGPWQAVRKRAIRT